MDTSATDAVLAACKSADWQQVVQNGGPPCFHLEGSQFCLRAERWQGHGVAHKFISLADFAQRHGARERLRGRLEQAEEAEKVVCNHCGNYILDQASILHTELAALENQDVVAQLDAARSRWDASVGTVEQATRAYEIAEVRFREGISTQTELSDSRLLLQQAQANRAQAARDLQVARIRAELLRDLPFVGSVAAGGTAR